MKLLLPAAILAFAFSATERASAEYFMTFGSSAEAGEIGRVKVQFMAGDPDRPIIVGATPNPSGAASNQSDLEFVVERASSATPKLMEACANGKVFPKIDFDTPGGAYALYGVRIAEVRAGAVRVRPGEPASPAALRTLRTDARVRISYQCAQMRGRAAGAAGPSCPQEAPASSDVAIKGKKILEN